jgi:hypothetical protein
MASARIKHYRAEKPVLLFARLNTLPLVVDSRHQNAGKRMESAGKWLGGGKRMTNEIPDFS